MALLHPIIYVRGFAMTEAERNETTADPFCGFNVGSTLYRATTKKDARPAKFVFESPVLRLVTDFQYRHVYQNGSDILDPDWEPSIDAEGNRSKGIPPQSIIIYRYYDDGSESLGDGNAKPIEDYAKGLSALILKVKSLVCSYTGPSGVIVKPDDFKCYLVAHSMGGLVVRAFLQNKTLGEDEARKSVHKLFTFATPHNGIEAVGLNVPRWLTAGQSYTFNRDHMADYLDMKKTSAALGNRVDYIPESVLPSDNIFCMVGTNRGDYEVLKGVVRAFVGDGSDGLVKVANASLWGINDKNEVTKPVATAYAYRSHSGHYGIVNSEEAYQNLIRFLFGDIRVDLWLDIDSVTLPTAIEPKAKDVDALYQFEVLVAPRGKRWYLSRRVSEEDSPACRTHEQLVNPKKVDDKSIYLSTVFLSKRARTNPKDPSMAYAMTFIVKVPDYQVEKRFWPDQHYEGANLFSNTGIFKLTPPQDVNAKWKIEFKWASEPDGTPFKELKYQKGSTDDEKIIFVDFANNRKPGIAGKIRLVVKAWGS